MFLHAGAQFAELQDELLFRLGRTREIKLRANSMFLLECIQEVKSKQQ
jgi:hypothetical protein